VTTKCEICHDVGHYRLEVDDIHSREFGRMIRCECKAIDDLSELQKMLGSPIDKVTLGNILDQGIGSQKMKGAAAEFVGSHSGYLTIWGTNGNGKTLTLQAIANECITLGVATVYVTASDLMQYIKDGIGKDFGVEDRVIKMATIPVLCIDELTQVNWTEFVSEKIETILDRRYAGRLGTVLAMDENPEHTLHRRVISRMSSGVIVENNDRDMRPLL